MKLKTLLLALFLITIPMIGCSNPSSNQPEESELNPDADGQPEERTPPVPLLLIGMDGFKPSYLDDERAGPTPNFDRLIEHGVRAESLKPVFPTKTFVNLYSIATGLYAENHGILGNTVYDPSENTWLRMRDSDAQQQSFWWGGEPIWITAEKQGLRAGTFFWVGSEAEIDGHRPTRWVPYDSRIPHRDRIDQVIDWLSDQEAPLNFATLYFASVDGAGHSHGPSSIQVTNMVQQMDRNLGQLIDGLEAAGIWPDINILIVSDHGMVETDTDHLIILDDIISLSQVQIIEFSPIAMINPFSGFEDRVYQALKDNEENYTVYRRDQIPEKFRFKNHPRTPALIAVADLPYTIVTRSFLTTRGVMAGNHGYDPSYPEMHGFFLAHGPGIRQGHQAPTLELVDIYALMAHLLGLEAASHDGSLERIGPEVLR